MVNLDQCLLDAVKAAYPESFLKGVPNADSCSGFVKSVAAKLGVPLPSTADADGLAEAVSGWTALPVAPPRSASPRARRRQLQKNPARYLKRPVSSGRTKL